MTDLEASDTSEEPLDQGGIAAVWAPRIDDPSSALMLNLLEFDPAGGAEEYAAYGRAMVPILDSVGALVILAGTVTETVIGEGRWDLVLVIEQQSRRAFLEMVNSDAYAQIGELRTDALRRSELRSMDPMPPLPESARQPVGAPPQTAPAALGTQIAAALDPSPVGGPALLLWLVELRADGAAPFASYMLALEPLLARAGAWLKTAAAPAETLIGSSERWDRMLALRFPSRDAVVSCLTSDAHSEIEHYRAAAVAREDLRVLDPMARWRY